MSKKIAVILRTVNDVAIEQRVIDGFINGTAMCVVYKKEITFWFRNADTLELVVALADDLGLDFNPEISQELEVTRLSASKES